ncbi:polysaccharide deacetylase family protein [Shimia sp.]|uniref:polysaccharide deacetylase family protein n=1 Tax=Shimia sp. TaxID=1954381 RepID=UPI003299DFAC
MNIDWSALRSELAQWRRDRLALPFWWRDDDAIEPTAALEKLGALSCETGVTVHLAVIPKLASDLLAGQMGTAFIPVMHGWTHRNTAPDGAKNAEFGIGRDPGEVKKELTAGIARMQDIFGDAFSRMFVPPWNRLDTDVLPILKSAGFSAVSTYAPRKDKAPVPGLEMINTHIDPIFWRGTRGLVPPETLVSQIVTLLRDRRLGLADNAEPLGYLTHHLVHDDDIWEFSRQFMTEMCEGPLTLFRHDRKDTA